jgi:hypothetical protein
MSERRIYICGGVVDGKRAGLHLATYLTCPAITFELCDDYTIHLTVGYMP